MISTHYLMNSFDIHDEPEYESLLCTVTRYSILNIARKDADPSLYYQAFL